MNGFIRSAAVAVALICAAPSAASAAKLPRDLSATFTAFGDGPNVEWTSSPQTRFDGFVQEVDTFGAPNVLINFTADSELAALGALEATMDLRGFYRSYLNETWLWFQMDFRYAGDTPFTVGGIEYGKGTRLLAVGDGPAVFDIDLRPIWGGSGVVSGIAGFTPSVTSSNRLYAEVGPVMLPAGYGGREYVQPGQDRWSGSITAIYVPEPAAWALMIIGFAGTGVMLRRRRPMPNPA